MIIVVSILLLLSVAGINLVTDRWRIPAYLAIMAAALAFGLGADMTIRSIGTTFALGFAQGLEQPGLLIVAGALAALLLPKNRLNPVGAGLGGIAAGIGATASGGLALAQVLARENPRLMLVLAFALMASHAMLPPAPLAIASAAVLSAEWPQTILIGGGATLLAITAGYLLAIMLPGSPEVERKSWLVFPVLALPLILLVLQSVAQMPTEPLGRGGAREFYIGASSPLALAIMTLALCCLARRDMPRDVLANTGWAPLLLAAGTATGFARMLDETGVAPLAAESFIDPKLGIWAPFLAAAVVKTIQGNSLSAVLTASGMIEPLLPALGLDDPLGHAIVAAACGAGAMALCHVNDPIFWIVRHYCGFTTAKTLRFVTLGSALMAVSVGLLLQVMVWIS